MKKKLIVPTLLLSSFIMTACINNGNTQQSSGVYNQNSLPNNGAISTSNTTRMGTNNTTAIQKSLAYMYDEERLAQEVYLAIYNKQPVQQLSKIASKAEGRHIDAVKSLAQRYGVSTPYQQSGRYQSPHIQSLYNELYSKGIRSKKDALEVGCMVEVIDVDDLNNYMNEAQKANAQDVLETYTFLRKGSYNHYWAFDRGLQQIGVSNGCCSLGQKYCHPEYPKKEKGGRGGQGHGQGGGMGRRWQ
jgi:hypothetical protein